jgi:hypothetical protein
MADNPNKSKMKNTIISTKEITKILKEFNYEPNPVMFQIFGEHVWFPKKEPTDLLLASKTIRMNELVTIKTESELRNLINLKLNK